MFQSFNLLARTSAIENVALPLFYAASGPSDRASRNERARSALSLLGLGDRARNTPGQLSGGQQQRVAIARALINTPSVLLADEPTGNLDSRTSYEIMKTLKRLNRERGVTIIIVTHEQDIAAYADRTVTMRDGQIISDERRPSEQPRGTVAGSGPAGATSYHLKSGRIVAAPSGTFWAFGRMIVAAAIQALARNKMRSALTMLGVFIGVAALIAMVAVGQGANEAVRKQIESLGTNLLVIVPGAARSGGVASRLWERLNSHCRRRPGDTARGSGCRKGKLPHPSGRPNPVRRQELDHEHPGCQRQLSSHHQLANRCRARHFTGR